MRGLSTLSLISMLNAKQGSSDWHLLHFFVNESQKCSKKCSK